MKMCQAPFGLFRSLCTALRVVVLLAILLSFQVPESRVQAGTNHYSNPFGACDCVYLGYDSAPKIVQRLIHWSLGARIEDYPAPPSGWVNWSAAFWPGNIERLGPQMDNRLDWDGAVNSTAEVGALVVWSGGSTVTWWADGLPFSYTHGDFGHIAVVSAYDPASNTISVFEKNWGECNPPERKNIVISEAMTFIHEPLPLDTIWASGGGAPPEALKPLQPSLAPLFPQPYLWEESARPVELYSNGNQVVGVKRADRCTTGIPGYAGAFR